MKINNVLFYVKRLYIPGSMDEPTGQQNCKIAPTEFDETIIDHCLEKGDE